MGIYRGYTRATMSVESVRHSSRASAALLAYVGTLWVTFVHHLGTGVAVEPIALLEALRDGTVMVPLLMLVLAGRDRWLVAASAAARAPASAAALGLVIPARALLASHQHAEQPLTLQYLF